MFAHNDKLMFEVRVDQPDPNFAKALLEQFGGPNGELAAAMRYFTQGWNEDDPKRRSLLLDIATEEMSHLEVVGQTIRMLLAGSRSKMVDEVEDGYLGDLLEGGGDELTHQQFALHSGVNLLGGGGARLVDSHGTPWTAAYIDTIGQPVADLASDIAAEARAKIVYERLIKNCDDPGVRNTLNFLMTREIAHQKAFEAALAAITPNFPPGTLPGDPKLAHLYVADSAPAPASARAPGFELASGMSDWSFELETTKAEDFAVSADGYSATT